MTEQGQSMSTATTGASSTTSLGGKSLIAQHFDRLRGNRKEFLILDGGTGEELFRRGVPDDRKIWSATACVHERYHSTLKSVHRSFIESGSNLITTNSYGITPGVGFSLAHMVQHVATAGRLAREAVSGGGEEKENKEDDDGECRPPALVAGSLGPLLESYRPDKVMPHAEGVATYKLMVEALLPFVDCFLAETMSSFEESSQAVEAVGAVSATVPMMVSYTLGSDGKVRSGEEAPATVRRIIQFASEKKVELLGVLFNCAEPEAITKALLRIREDASLQSLLLQKGVILGAYANRLTPVAADWSMEESDGPQPFRSDLDPADYFHRFVSVWCRDLGVQMIGGCCGFTPEHISYISSHMASLP